MMIKTTIVGFGDSITNGYGVNTNLAYIHQLEKWLPTYYPAILWDIHKISKNKLTSREAVPLFKKNVLELRPNIVFIMLGTNDCAKIPKLHRSLEEFKANLEEILEALHHHNNHTGLNSCVPIPVLITPPLIYSNLGYSERDHYTLSQYVNTILEIAQHYDCPCIDFYHKILSEENYTHYLAKDGYHLSEEGYGLLFDLVFSEFTKLINYQGVIKERITS